MNILKLIKAQTKTSKKAVALKQSVVDGVIVNIDSAQAIARVVHTAAFTRWDAAQDKAAVEAFKAAQDKAGIRYQFMSRAGRKDVLREAANTVGRSPAALKIRLASLGKLPSRKSTTKDDLQSLVGKKA
jgi:hypothetical protein